AYTFLQTSMAANNQFDPAQMTKPTAPGMYVTYTLARVHSALSKAGVPLDAGEPPADLSDGDVRLLGWASYAAFHLHQAAEGKDPAPLAKCLLALVKELGAAYAKQSIKGGPVGFQYAVARAYQALENGLVLLGLFPLHEV